MGARQERVGLRGAWPAIFELTGKSGFFAMPGVVGMCGLLVGLLTKGVETLGRFDALLMLSGRLVRLVIEKMVTEGR